MPHSSLAAAQRWSVALAVAAATAACSTGSAEGVDCHGRFRMEGFSDAESADLRVAAARWSAFATLPVTVDVAESACVIRKLDPTSDEFARFVADHDGRDFGGVYTQKDGSIRLHVATSCEGRCLQASVLHELGHAAGLSHCAPTGGVMGSDASAPDFTSLDLVECIRVGACTVR